jgi:hypothetical protein
MDNPHATTDASGTMDHVIPSDEVEYSHRFGTISETLADEMTEWRARVEALIERYPWPTLLLALSLGYLLARRTR